MPRREPRRQYATIFGYPHEFFQFITLVEHTKDALAYIEGWEVEKAIYGYYDAARNVSLDNVIDGVDDAHKVTDVHYGAFLACDSNDVTHIVKELWANRKTIRATNAHFADPCYGHRKMLFVTL